MTDFRYPERVSCPSCGEKVELDPTQRMEGQLSCPRCHSRINLLSYPAGRWKRLTGAILDSIILFAIVFVVHAP